MYTGSLYKECTNVLHYGNWSQFGVETQVAHHKSVYNQKDSLDVIEHKSNFSLI